MPVGHETSANALSWTQVPATAAHPEEQTDEQSSRRSDRQHLNGAARGGIGPQRRLAYLIAARAGIDAHLRSGVGIHHRRSELLGPIRRLRASGGRLCRRHASRGRCTVIRTSGLLRNASTPIDSIRSEAKGAIPAGKVAVRGRSAHPGPRRRRCSTTFGKRALPRPDAATVPRTLRTRPSRGTTVAATTP